MTKLPIRRSNLISYADRPLSRGIATAFSMGLTPGEGGGAPVVLPLVASAGVRSQINYGTRSVAAVDFITHRLAEKTNVAGDEFQADFWNGWVDAGVTNVAQEKAIGGARQMRMSIVTGVSGTGLNQTGATLAMLTWQNAANGVAGYIYKLDGTPASAAEFTAASGLISGDFQTITVPDGWYVASDKAAVSLTASQKYFIQTEILATGTLVFPTNIRGISGVGDAQSQETGTPVKVSSVNWTSGGALVSGTAIIGPVATWVRNASGKRVTATAGDSIAHYQNDSVAGSSVTTGDADGCVAFLNRALNAAGYSWVRTAVSSAQARALYNYGGHAIRELMLRNCSAVLSDMGHNDRSTTWLGAAPSGYLATYRWYWARLRAACLGGAGRVVQTTLFPSTTSSDSYATTANQTLANMTIQLASINPFIAANLFDTSVGDPDAGYDLTIPLYSAATVAAGFTDIDGPHQKWPANGLTGQSAAVADGIHPKGAIHAVVAADLAPQLPTLLGFAA